MFSIVGASFPVFVFGLLVLMLFYARLQWFPPGRLSDWALAVVNSSQFHQYTHLMTVDSLLNGRFDIFWDALRHLMLPILTLSYVSWATFLRVTRSSMLKTLGQEYVTAARAKGLTEGDVVNKHARPNALIPVVTLIGIQIGSIIEGAFITETVFSIPGIGRLAVQAIPSHDYPVVKGVVLISAISYMLSTLLVDVLYAWIDQRISYATAGS